MNQINWAQVVIFAAVVLAVFILGITFLSFLFGGWGMMGPGMMGPGMMGGWSSGYGGWMGGILGWLFMLVAMALPLGLLILLILGAVWLARGVSGPGVAPRPAPPPVETCPNCGQGVQADWRVCPYCEQSLGPASEK